MYIFVIFKYVIYAYIFKGYFPGLTLRVWERAISEDKVIFFRENFCTGKPCVIQTQYRLQLPAMKLICF